MDKTFRMTSVVVVSCFLTFAPVLVSAEGLVPCSGERGNECQVCDLVKLADNVTDWFVLVFGVIAALSIVAAGGWMSMSTGNVSAKEWARKRIAFVVVGYILVLAGWLMVDTILKAFLGDQAYGIWNDIQCVDHTIEGSSGAFAGDFQSIVNRSVSEAPPASRELIQLNDAVNGVQYASNGTFQVPPKSVCEGGIEAFQDAAKNEPYEYAYYLCRKPGENDQWIDVTGENVEGASTIDLEKKKSAQALMLIGYSCHLVHNHPQSWLRSQGLPDTWAPSSEDLKTSCANSGETLGIPQYVTDPTGVWSSTLSRECTEVDYAIIGKMMFVELQLLQPDWLEKNTELIIQELKKSATAEQYDEILRFMAEIKKMTKDQLINELYALRAKLPFEYQHFPNAASPAVQICRQ